MGIKFVIQRNQNDEIKHDEKFEEQHPRDDKGRFTVAAFQTSGQILKGIQDVSNEATKIPIEKGKTTYGKYPNISDQDLNKYVNRLNLEHRYSDLKGDTKYVKSGQEKTRELLQTIGAVAGVAGTVMGTIATILAVTRSKSNNK